MSPSDDAVKKRPVVSSTAIARTGARCATNALSDCCCRRSITSVRPHDRRPSSLGRRAAIHECSCLFAACIRAPPPSRPGRTDVATSSGCNEQVARRRERNGHATTLVHQEACEHGNQAPVQLARTLCGQPISTGRSVGAWRRRPLRPSQSFEWAARGARTFDACFAARLHRVPQRHVPGARPTKIDRARPTIAIRRAARTRPCRGKAPHRTARTFAIRTGRQWQQCSTTPGTESLPWTNARASSGRHVVGCAYGRELGRAGSRSNARAKAGVSATDLISTGVPRPQGRHAASVRIHRRMQAHIPGKATRPPGGLQSYRDSTDRLHR